LLAADSRFLVGVWDISLPWANSRFRNYYWAWRHGDCNHGGRSAFGSGQFWGTGGDSVEFFTGYIMVGVSKLVKAGLLVGASLAAIGIQANAAAESLFTRDRNVSVNERPREGYEPTGIRLGSFIVRPKVDLTIATTDNVFAVTRDVSPQFGERADTYVILRPSFMTESDWNRHSLRFGAYAEGYQHDEFAAENVFNSGVFLDGRVDVTREFSFIGGGSYDRLNEARKATSVVATPSEPIEYDFAQAYLGTLHEWGRFRARSRVEVRDYDFKDARLIGGGTQDQQFRDRAEVNYLGEVGFAMTKDSAVFARLGYNTRNYNGLDPNGLNRDSDGWNIQTGVDFDITRLARGAIAVGYMEQDYDDPGLDKVSGVSVDAGLEWFPTEMTTLSLSASRDVRESALFNTGGYTASEAIIRIDHELARNIVGYVSAGIGRDAYEDIARTDDRYGGAVGIKWWINQMLSAKAEYVYENNETDQDPALQGQPGFFGKDYETNEFFITLTAER